MSSDLLKLAAELERQWSTVEAIIVRVHVSTLREQSEVAEAAKAWSVTRGRPLAGIDRRVEEFVLNEERSYAAGFPCCEARNPFVDFRFPPDVSADQLLTFARIVTPWSTQPKPDLVIEPRTKGAEA